MSLSATLFGRDSFIHRATNIMGLGIPGYLDRKFGVPDPEKPVADTSYQTSTYGAPLPRIYGTIASPGNVFWLENNKLKAVTRKQKQGGKGGDSQTVEVIEYYATFAVALADTSKTGPIAGVQRIWLGSTLYYNAGSDDLETIIASNKNAEKFKIYYGTADQMPDPRMQADVGVDNCPAYRRTAYIVFYDLALKKYGNSLQAAQVKVELFGEDADTSLERLSIIQMPMAAPTSSLVCQYLTPSIAWVLRSNWTSLYPSSSSYDVWRFDTVKGRFSSRVSVTGGTINKNFIRTVSDDPDVRVNHEYMSSIGGSSSSTGKVVIKGGITYAVESSYSVIRRIGDGANLTLSVPSQVAAISADDAGRMYTLDTAKNIRIYDENLLLLSSFATGIAQTVVQNSAHIHCDSGLIYVYLESGLDSVFVYTEEGVLAAGPFLLTAGPSGSSLCTFTVAGRIISRAYYDNSGGNFTVERWNSAAANLNTVSLASVIGSELMLSELIREPDIDVSALAAQVRGIRIAGGTLRSAVAPLQGAYPFDLIPSGYQIKAVPRGQASVATVDIGELGAVPGTGMADVVLDGPSREMDSQLPRKVTIKHLDPARDYDINEQSYARIATDSVDIEAQELPLVLTVDEAAGMAQVLLFLRWLERDDYAFTLPPTHAHLEPGDVIDVVTDYGTIPLRLPEIQYGADGVLSIKAKPNSPAVYESNAVGGQGAIPGGNISLIGDAETVLLDIPLIRNDDNNPSFAAAMAGTTESWPGGLLFRSADNEQTWSDVQAWAAPVTMGAGRTALTAHDGLVIDRVSALQVDLIIGELESITEAQMMTGINWAAYGADGRWELIRFADAELQTDGSYILSTLLRGLRGSEWATGLHEYGDTFVLLDDPDVMATGADLSTLSVVRKWRGVTAGQSIDEVSSIDFAYRGVNLKPLSAVHGVAYLSGADWVIEWDPRTRLQGSLWKTGVALPIGESTESYQIDILDGTDVVRTLVATTDTVTYTEAQQTEDFGSAQSSIDAIVYQISADVGRGYPHEISA
jgi:hypothetical protein